MNEMRRHDDATSTKAGTQMPSVSVVILTWNGRKFLEQFLPSVLASSYSNKRIIVADNASIDGSVEFLIEKFPGVEILVNSSNEGFAKGYNTALKQIESDYYVLLNSDVEVQPGWIEPVISLMESDEKIGACQSKILSYQNKKMFEYAGAAGGWLDNLGYPFSRGRVFDDCEEDTGQYDNAAPCFWASGAAMFVKAELYHKLGGLDEYFFAHQEEIDFCWRMQLAGFKVFVQPASVVYHVGGGTLPKGNSRKTYLNFRNNLIMLAKNLPFGKAIWKVPVRFGLDGVSAWRGLFSGDGGYFIAILRAHFHFVKWFFLERKKSVFPSVRTGSVSGWFPGSAAWGYFIRKKKTFDKIVGNK